MNHEKPQPQELAGHFETEQLSAEERLQEFQETFDLPDELVDAYQVENMRLHSFGVASYDESIAATLGRVQNALLKSSLDQYKVMYDVRPATAAIMERASNRNERRLAKNKSVRRETRRQVLQHDTRGPWLETLSRQADEGILVGNCSVILEQTELNYFSEFNWEIPDTLLIDTETANITKNDLLAVFSSEEVESGITVKAFAERLRERGSIDLSKETLDARFSNMSANLHIELIRYLIHSIHDIARMENAPNMSEALLQSMRGFEGQFASADLEKLAGMVVELRTVLERYVDVDSGIDTRAVRIVAKGTHVVQRQIGSLVYGFLDIYKKLGYELPPFLQKIEAQEMAKSAPKSEASTSTPSTTAPAPKNEQGSAFSDEEEAQAWLMNELLGKIDSLEHPYRYTSDKIRSFKNGTKLVRDMEIELAHKKLLTDRDIVQALGILIGQSQYSGVDKTEYFVTLFDAQVELEGLLHDLNKNVSQPYRSSLINALHWLDELVDSGNDIKIKNHRLLTLIHDYCIGPEVDIEETPESLTILPLVHNPREGEIPISDRSTAEALQAARKRAHEVYGEILSSILDQEEIEFVDVVASALNQSRTNHRATRLRQNDIRYADIDPNRLIGLIRLRDTLREQGKLAELKFIKGAQNQKYPPFILCVQSPNKATGGVCLLENPVVGYSSRLYPVGGRDWRNIITLSRSELAAQDITVRTKIHKPKGSPIFDQHYALDLLNLINLNL